MTQPSSPPRRSSRTAKPVSFTDATSNRRSRWLYVLAFALIGGAGGAWFYFQQPRRSTTQTVRVINSFPHDRNAWSQGLAIDEVDGTLIEGTGLYRQSSLRRVELETGNVLQQVDLDARLFGEGITLLGDRIYQLTWREKVGLVYDRETLREVARFRLDGEGWGLTTDGTHLIVSDGSSTLTFRDPKTFAVAKRVRVTSGGRAVSQLNELEFVEGEIWANVWHQDYIVRIDPATGRALGSIDLSAVYPRRDRTNREHVLNGIAYDAKRKRLFITGKNWPKLYEVEVIDAPR